LGVLYPVCTVLQAGGVLKFSGSLKKRRRAQERKSGGNRENFIDPDVSRE
jgi:hypothetical protein